MKALKNKNPKAGLHLTPAEADSFLAGGKEPLPGHHEVALDSSVKAGDVPNLAAVKPHAPAVIRKKG